MTQEAYCWWGFSNCLSFACASWMLHPVIVTCVLSRCSAHMCFLSWWLLWQSDIRGAVKLWRFTSGDVLQMSKHNVTESAAHFSFELWAVVKWTGNRWISGHIIVTKHYNCIVRNTWTREWCLPWQNSSHNIKIILTCFSMMFACFSTNPGTRKQNHGASRGSTLFQNYFCACSNFLNPHLDCWHFSSWCDHFS